MTAIILSRMDLSGTNVDWLFEMHLSKTSFNRLASTLATTLYKTLHNAMGWGVQ